MKKLGLGLAVLAMSAASTAFAATGVITFNGELVAGSCDATVGGAGSSSTVTMSTVNIADLAATGDTAGATPFKINLNGAGCTAGAKIATPYFEPEAAKVNAQGRLINTGDADKVDVQLLTDAQAPIDINKPAATQESSAPVVVSATSNDFNYTARYFATDATVEGAVAASVSYNIVYK